jgi:hypothetical protein
VNVKEEHPEYGWALVTSKSSTSTKKGTYLKTTGKEQFNPNCNDNLAENETTRKIEALKKPTRIIVSKPIRPPSEAFSIEGELLFETIKGPKINLKKQLKITKNDQKDNNTTQNNDNISENKNENENEDEDEDKDMFNEDIPDHKKWDKWGKSKHDDKFTKLRINPDIKFRVKDKID